MLCLIFGTDFSDNRYRTIDVNRIHNTHGFVFGETSSERFNIYITDMRTFGTPVRDVSFQSVAGRNGELTLDNKRWSNIEIVYSCAIPTDFADNFTRFKASLLSQTGYQRLTDTGETDVFRLGVVRDAIDPTVIRQGRGGKFDVRFYCKPQKFYLYGEYREKLTEPRTLHNQTGCVALPLITVYGTGAGNLTVGNTTVEIKALADQITIDCDLLNAYRQVGDSAKENKNGDIYAPEFPVLEIGENPVSWDGEITAVDIVPRWWRL